MFYPYPERSSEPLPAQICEIQGDGFVSPLAGQIVSTEGVVTMDLDQSWQRGFFLQDAECDTQDDTSDAIFVYLGDNEQVVNDGDEVHVEGQVGEYHGLTEIISTPSQVTLISPSNPMPEAVDLNPPTDDIASSFYFESIEAMLVERDEGIVVGPTDGDDRSWLVNSDLGINRVFVDDPSGVGEIICVDDAGYFEITPEVKVTDLVQALFGILDYRGGEYCLQLLSEPLVIPSTVDRTNLRFQSDSSVLSFSIGSFNLANLFDTIDDVDVEDEVLGPTEYQRRLHKRALAIQALGQPNILAVQEVEKSVVLQELIDQSEIVVDYAIIHEDGPDRRGLDVALLYNPDSFELLDYQIRQGCTSLIDGLGPDGNGDVLNPDNSISCDSDGDQHLDGNRLFSRPPLVAHLASCEVTCESLEDYEVELVVIVNHWKSKYQDSEAIQYTLPRRLDQADFVVGLVDEALSAHPGVIVILIGDFNDYPASAPMQVLRSRGIYNLMLRVERDQRYTYIYEGKSEVLDYLLIFPQTKLVPLQANILHVNSDFPYMYLGITDSIHRSSDHDPVSSLFQVMTDSVYLPFASR